MKTLFETLHPPPERGVFVIIYQGGVQKFWEGVGGVLGGCREIPG